MQATAPEPQLSEMRIAEIIFPHQANHYGTLFAGVALSLMSRSALLAAAYLAGGDVVMAGCEAVRFRSPVRVGEVLAMTAAIVWRGRSSMTVKIVGRAGAPGGPDQRPVIEGLFQMVAVDTDGRPRRIPVPEGIPAT
jgi:acyl-CoA hydrolase